MDKQTIIAKITALAEDILGVDGIEPDKNMKDHYHSDSLDAVELVMAIDEEFNLSTEDAEAEHCRTVNDLADLVEKKLQVAHVG